MIGLLGQMGRSMDAWHRGLCMLIQAPSHWVWFERCGQDESHALKESSSQRTITLAGWIRKSKRAIFISGTPALNRPVELYTTVSFQVVVSVQRRLSSLLCPGQSVTPRPVRISSSIRAKVLPSVHRPHSPHTSRTRLQPCPRAALDPDTVAHDSPFEG